MRHLQMLCLLGALIVCTPVLAQDDSTALTPGNDIVLSLFGRSREDLFCTYLKVSRSERPLFMEALVQYETEKDPYIQERMALLKVYNEKYTSLDEPMMNGLTKNIIQNDKEFVALQTRFYRRMIKLLGATRAAMFFQLDNYLELSTRLFIQDDLPFIKELESDRKMAVARMKANIH